MLNKSRTLIVNADDANLTRGVTEAILDCHERGIVSSTTWLVNFPEERGMIRRVKRMKQLGVGLHLNITKGNPVMPASKVTSLLDDGGNFSAVKTKLSKMPNARDVEREYRRQIQFFKQLFGRLPTHLDTHHQLHDVLFYLRILTRVAKSFRLPIRRSKRMPPYFSGIATDYFFGCLRPSGYWRAGVLKRTLENLPEGISEIMCHPGKNDGALRAVSTFTTGREAEYRLLGHPQWRRFIREQKIVLSHYGLCLGS